MKHSIQNGILIWEKERIVLAKVSRWWVSQNGIVFVIGGQQFTLQVGNDAAAIDAELVEHFTHPLVKVEMPAHPLASVLSNDPPKPRPSSVEIGDRDDR